MNKARQTSGIIETITVAVNEWIEIADESLADRLRHVKWWLAHHIDDDTAIVHEALVGQQLSCPKCSCETITQVRLIKTWQTFATQLDRDARDTLHAASWHNAHYDEEASGAQYVCDGCEEMWPTISALITAINRTVNNENVPIGCLN